MPGKSKAAQGIFWSAVERFSVQGIQFLLSIVIARLVSPSDYGLIAMLGIFLAVAQQFIDSGFSNALIQKKDRSEIDFSTVFYFNLAIAGIVYLALFFATSWIADFYSEPELIPVTRWIGLTVVFMAFSVVQRAKLTIELDFKTQAKVSLVAVAISGSTGIVLAWQGYGVWALVAQSLVNTFLVSALLWRLSRWKLQLVFSWTSFRQLFSFGSKLLIVGVLHVFYTNIYTLIIGKKFSASDVGYFNRAQTLALFPSVNISSIIVRALYPLLCELQDNDEALKRSFLNALRHSVYIVFPLMTGMCVLSEPLIRVILTDKWLPAAPLLSILCLAYIWNPIMSLNWYIINARGRSDLALKAELWSKGVALSILACTLPWGLFALCWGIVLSGIVDAIIMIHYVKKVLGIGYGEELRHLSPFFLLSLITAIAVFAGISLVQSPWNKLFIGTSVGLLSYVGFSFIFNFREVRSLSSILTKCILRS